MSFYLDTSILVSAIAAEAESLRVQTWLASQQPDQLRISEWVTVEVSSALALKVRTRQLTPSERLAGLSMFKDLALRNFEVLGVLPRHFREAAALIDRGALPLRAADALHLAVAMGDGATLCTLDRGFEAAARAYGVKTLRP